ncbi:MAG: hypothetical protein IPK18_01640 [Sphingobacteriales bacterium]|jgi:hypothetical protein|nr:MAG: hypothetical protein IPK18_01640 [Sphingobacteriales bacterium]
MSKTKKQQTAKKPSTKKSVNEASINYCGIPIATPRTFDSTVNAERASFIIANDKYWANGTDLKFYFMGGTNLQKETVRKAFKRWKNVGIGITFTEVDIAETSHIRISFDPNDSNGTWWSYVGRDILDIRLQEKTMNLGGNFNSDYAYTATLHEIGHTLGLKHEHQNPNSGIEWDKDKVYSYFQTSNGWNTSKVDSNILNKINNVTGSAWDKLSIMHYSFPSGLILKPSELNKTGISINWDLSPNDIKWVKSTYPGKNIEVLKDIASYKPEFVTAPAGSQDTFVFKPEYSSKYQIMTHGNMDSVVVVFQEVGNGVEYLSGDDNSGTPNGSTIELRLLKGVTYRIAVRVMFRERTDNTILLVIPTS